MGFVGVFISAVVYVPSELGNADVVVSGDPGVLAVNISIDVETVLSAGVSAVGSFDAAVDVTDDDSDDGCDDDSVDTSVVESTVEPSVEEVIVSVVSSVGVVVGSVLTVGAVGAVVSSPEHDIRKSSLKSFPSSQSSHT